ncbi:hypothetical protein [[Clostridium] scindens]|uniref:hypothetical protein n=1 Tax=Clostridium scindens (strain JCM 10418 / VPI 12708) TaxID=29347 RepID=UPI001D061615|nr:hypothetical protein [[Clostridium] scindens]MCB6286247.1 hypothetical protein [[Clostridium] scindens]MCB6421003.1 hypothetical protein [[Clostridium] scindens]
MIMAESQPRLSCRYKDSLETKPPHTSWQGDNFKKKISPAFPSRKYLPAGMLVWLLVPSVLALTLPRYYLRERTCNAGMKLSKSM